MGSKLRIAPAVACRARRLPRCSSALLTLDRIENIGQLTKLLKVG